MPERTSAGAIMMLLGVLLLVVLTGYAGIVLFYFLFQERFIFLRVRTGQGHRYRYRTPFEERFVVAPDGARLHALYFKTGKPRGVLIFFHGNAGSLRRWGRFAPRFLALGYDVLMPDPRGYGKSRGASSEAALISDAVLWYDHALEQWKDKDIVIYGRSLGSALATPVAAQRAPRLLLLETPFANLIDVARYYLPILPYRVLLRYPFRNDMAMARVRCPVYIFHGKRDTVVPYVSALRLYAHIPSTVQRELYTFAKGHHSDLERFPRFLRVQRRLLSIPGRARKEEG